MILAQSPRQRLSGNRILIFLTFCFLQMTVLLGQTSDCEQGKTHVVEKGQTIYGISKQYNVSQEDLLRCNPELAKDGLKLGASIKIPQKSILEKNGQTKSVSNESVQLHVVKAKETIYGISKTYNISQEQLLQLNPELEQGLKIGMELKIPISAKAPSQMKTDKEKNQKETLPENEHQKSEQDRSAKEEAVEVKLSCKPLKGSEKAKVHKIALLLPFHSSLQERLNPRSKIGIDFYQGVKYAMDSLRKEGLFARLYVFDTQNDSNVVRSLIRKGQLDEMDLIIGPLFNSIFVQVSDYAKQKKIPIVSPFVQADAIIRNNPYAVKVTPDQEMLTEASARFLKKNYPGSELILVANSLEKDKDIIKNFKEAFSNVGLQFKQINYTSFSEVSQTIDEQKQTIVVFPSTAQAQVYDFVAKMNGIRNKNIMLFGLAEWNNFENMEYQYLDNLKFHYASSALADFTSEESLRFQNAFREEFKTEASAFALHGFDVGYYFLRALLHYGSDFYKCLSEFPEYTGFNSNMKFTQLNKQSGFENASVFIVRIEDLTAKKLNRNE